MRTYGVLSLLGSSRSKPGMIVVSGYSARALLLRLPDGLCRQQVKPSIIANHKLIHAILHDACLYCGGQGGEYAVWSIPVTNEKVGTHFSPYPCQIFLRNYAYKVCCTYGLL